jgi:hypothetical protein
MLLMKTLLLIWMISLHDGQQPTVQKLEQPEMPSCEAEAKSVHRQLDFKFRPGECGPGGLGCSPPYIVRTGCVTEGGVSNK